LDEVLCQSPEENCFFGECSECLNRLPSYILRSELNDDVNEEDEACWLNWSSNRYDDPDHEDDIKIVNKKIMLHRINGSVNDLIDEFDFQWSKFVAHHYNTRQQIDYIKQIKLDSDDEDGIVVEMDFAENHSLIIQHQVQQAYYNTAQATIFTINIHVTNITHHAMAIISDCLDHDVKFVHAAQKIIVQFVRDNYPHAKHLNYVTDGAAQHFKSNKSILNLTHHHEDFGIAASWTFSSTAHGKSSVDGIGASLKYKATRRVLSGDRTDAIHTPRDLYYFASTDTSLNVFYLDSGTIQANTRKYNLEDRLNQSHVKGKYKLIISFEAYYLNIYYRLDSVYQKHASVRSNWYR
jgi:hypothetical protein